VRTLLDRGMIRTANGAKRGILLEIDPAGHAMVIEVTAIIAAKEQQLFTGIDDRARAQFSQMIDHLSAQAARLLAYDRAIANGLFSPHD
jgi:DNA-binding MarR family transcriptional regulator